MVGPMPGDNDPVTPTTWLPDPSHYPEQLTPLSATVWFEAIGRGLHAAMAELKGPFGGFEARTELGWAYEGDWAPRWDHAPDRMEQAALDIDRSWNQVLAPRSHEITANLAALRPDLPGRKDALALIDEAWSLILEQWKIHFLAVIPAQMSAEMFSRRYREAMGASEELAPYRILESLPNETNQADQEVWSLAQKAIELRIDDIFTEYPPDLVLDRLAQSVNGRALIHELDAYLIKYGGRSRWHELSLPREVENPQMTIQSIRLFIEAGAGPRSADHSEAAELEQRFLQADPGARDLLQAAKVGHSLKESHVYHIDYPTLLVTRELLLGLGRRLSAEGLLDSAADVWMLQREEVRDAVAGNSSRSLSSIVAERRDELARGFSEGPREYLGQPPAATERDAILEKFYGSGVSHDQSVTDMVGIAASRGRASGPARLVLGPDDFSRVKPGDVLVATTTTPAWTPLFPSLAGIITESGGVLCHGAIVAREYGIPAVVGMANATSLIPDGSTVTVDGDTGRVETGT